MRRTEEGVDDAHVVDRVLDRVRPCLLLQHGAREGWLQSLATAFVTAAFFYFALEKFFQIGLLKGPIEPLIGL